MEHYHNELTSDATQPMAPIAPTPDPQTPARGYVNRLAQKFGLDDYETPPRARQLDIDQERTLYLSLQVDPDISILKFWEVCYGLIIFTNFYSLAHPDSSNCFPDHLCNRDGLPCCSGYVCSL